MSSPNTQEPLENTEQPTAPRLAEDASKSQVKGSEKRSQTLKAGQSTVVPWWKGVQSAAVKVFNVVKWVLLVIAVFLVLALIASWNMNRHKTYSKQELQQVHSLVLYAAKSAEEAERVGRTDPMQGLLNANYAVCYVNAAKHMVNDETLESLVGTSMAELEQYLNQLQHTLLQTVLKQCEVGQLRQQSLAVQKQQQQQQQQRQRRQRERDQNENLKNAVEMAKERQATVEPSTSGK